VRRRPLAYSQTAAPGRDLFNVNTLPVHEQRMTAYKMDR
jgi:hypothetical protein